MTDPFDRLVELRPPVPDESGWASSPAGREALARVQATATRRPWWTRRRFVVPTVVVGLGAALGAGVVAFAPADRKPVADTLVVCASTPDRRADLTGIAATSGADHAVIVAQCNAAFVASGDPVPVDFAECVFGASRGQIGGAEVAVPSTVVVTPANAAALCQAAGFEPAG